MDDVKRKGYKTQDWPGINYIYWQIKQDVEDAQHINKNKKLVQCICHPNTGIWIQVLVPKEGRWKEDPRGSNELAKKNCGEYQNQQDSQ